MSKYVRMMPFTEVYEEFSGCVDYVENGEVEEYHFTNVDCTEKMLKLLDPEVWYVVEEEDEDGDVRLKLLFGMYPKELIVERQED